MASVGKFAKVVKKVKIEEQIEMPIEQLRTDYFKRFYNLDLYTSSIIAQFIQILFRLHRRGTCNKWLGN